MNTEILTDQSPTNPGPTDPSPTDPSATDQSPADQKPTDQGVTDQSPADQKPADDDLDKYLNGQYKSQALRRGDLRTGEVIEANERGLIVDIGLKQEGIVHADDLARLDQEISSEIQVGATVPVLVIRPYDREGRPVLSIQQAYMQQDWLKAEEMMKSGEIYEGEISGHNRGGVVVQFGKIRGFVPASQLVGLPRRLREEERRNRLAAMTGQQVGLKIIEVDRRRRRLIFSQRRALRVWQEMQRERVMSDLTEGETRQGKVTDITDFGAFVDLGGADGLIHVSELSWKRVENPRQVLSIGDEVDVYVLEVDRKRKRIALSLKKLQPDPWTIVDDHYHVGQLIEGRVTRVLDFGAFIELDLGLEGLLHASEMIGTPEIPPSEIVHPGETLLVKIIRIESQRRRLALSARQVKQSEWERWVADQQAAREAEEEAAREAAEVKAKTKVEAEAEAERKAAEPEPAVIEAAEVEEEEPELAVIEAAEVEEKEPEPAVIEAAEVEEEPEPAEIEATEAEEEPEPAVIEAAEVEEEPEPAVIEAAVVEEEPEPAEIEATEAEEEPEPAVIEAAEVEEEEEEEEPELAVIEAAEVEEEEPEPAEIEATEAEEEPEPAVIEAAEVEEEKPEPAEIEATEVEEEEPEPAEIEATEAEEEEPEPAVIEAAVVEEEEATEPEMAVSEATKAEKEAAI